MDLMDFWFYSLVRGHLCLPLGAPKILAWRPVFSHS